MYCSELWRLGLYYSNARWYDPNIGRFITEDPIKDGNNWYIYAGNNPLRFIDPTGLQTVSAAPTGVSAAGWAALVDKFGIYGATLLVKAGITVVSHPMTYVVLFLGCLQGDVVSTGIEEVQSELEAAPSLSAETESESNKSSESTTTEQTTTSTGGNEEPGDNEDEDEDRIKVEDRKDLKKLVKKLSQDTSEPLNQEELDSLKELVKDYDAEVRVDLDGVKGTGSEPHAHVEGMGTKVEARHIWLQDGVK